MSDPRTDLDARLEAEIQAALGDLSIEDILADEERPGGKPKVDRQIRSGMVVAVRGGDVLVEFGPRMQGVCPLEQFEAEPVPGASMDFIIERFDKNDEIYMLSRRGAVQKAAWESLEVGQTVEARCTGTNKGGLEMEIAHHRAFMPAGQVDIRHIPDLDQFINEKLTCEVIELDRNRSRLILSRRAHLEKERMQQREELLARLEVGQELSGTVTTVKPYGAFVDLGGLDGLVHVSDLSHSRVHDPQDVVKEGDLVRVKVLKIDTSEDPVRVSLGMKQCMADPFESTASELAEGSTVSGRVTKIMNFGAFVEVAPGVEGLIHISELAHDRVQRVDQVVREGEIVQVKVVSIDRDKQRIALSRKALLSSQDESAERRTDKAMDKLKARFGSDWGDLKGGLG